jgi:hypothetical protein
LSLVKCWTPRLTPIAITPPSSGPKSLRGGTSASSSRMRWRICPISAALTGAATGGFAPMIQAPCPTPRTVLAPGFLARSETHPALGHDHPDPVARLDAHQIFGALRTGGRVSGFHLEKAFDPDQDRTDRDEDRADPDFACRQHENPVAVGKGEDGDRLRTGPDLISGLQDHVRSRLLANPRASELDADKRPTLDQPVLLDDVQGGRCAATEGEAEEESPDDPQVRRQRPALPGKASISEAISSAPPLR